MTHPIPSLTTLVLGGLANDFQIADYTVLNQTRGKKSVFPCSQTHSLLQDFRANQRMERIGLGHIHRAAKQLFQLLSDTHQCQQ